MTIKMHTKLFMVLVVVTLMPLVFSRNGKYSRLQTDPLSKTRCDLTCFDVGRDRKPECRAQCRAQEHKPGTCPSADSPKWAAACVEACNSDSQCDGTQRCCRLGCGATCSQPVDLLSLPGLPALPIIEEVREKKRSVMIRWSNGVGDAARNVPGKVMYLLQEQHHVGPKYEEARLGEWNLIMRTNKTKASLKNLVKSGRWYRFRVAAVSSSGTRGFSDPSAPFSPRKGPRAPPPPKRLRVKPVKNSNGTVTVRLEWKEPRSDLPVIKYKVFWSRRVRGVGGELDSVLVNHQTVPKEQTQLEIKDLLPNSMYFLQVQTISQFGLGKLRSDKAAIFYNTTSNTEYLPAAPLFRRTDRIKGLKLQTIVWYNHKLKARISWEPVAKSEGKPRRYYVQWKTIECESPNKKIKELSATTEQTIFDIYELEYHCSYKVNVNRSWKSITPDSELVVKVPGCEYFQQRVNGTALNCKS